MWLPSGTSFPSGKPSYIDEQVEMSLGHLRTICSDLYYQHRIDTEPIKISGFPAPHGKLGRFSRSVVPDLM